MYPVREIALAILIALGAVGLGAGLALAVPSAVVATFTRL